MGGARDDLVACDDAVIHLHPVVRRRGEDLAEILDLGGEAGWASAGVLDIGFGEQLWERTRVVCVYRCHILVQKYGSGGTGRASRGTIRRRQCGVRRHKQRSSAENPMRKHISPVRHIDDLLT
jgi:hypothetical protein